MERQYCSSVYIVDFEKEKTLLMYNKKLNKWLQPGGHINNDEVPTQACIREALEETGIIVKIIGEEIYGEISNLCIARYINKVGDMIDIQYVGVALNDLNSNDENNEVGWFSIEEMQSMNVDKEIIEKVIYILNNYKKYASLVSRQIIKQN